MTRLLGSASTSSAQFTLIMQKRDDDSRVISFGLDCNCFTFVAQLWCMKNKGAVFVTMFDPVTAVMVALLSYFMFRKMLYIGR